MNQESLTDIVGRSDELKELCFSFFMAFSRFEFALKENGYRHRGRYGEVTPDWKLYRERFADHYWEDAPARALRLAPPRQQVFDDAQLAWRAVNLEREPSALGQAMLMLKTIRNNLFHGGKHGADDWDDRERTTFLLSNGILVLDALAALGGIAGDYERRY